MLESSSWPPLSLGMARLWDYGGMEEGGEGEGGKGSRRWRVKCKWGGGHIACLMVLCVAEVW